MHMLRPACTASVPLRSMHHILDQLGMLTLGKPEDFGVNVKRSSETMPTIFRATSKKLRVGLHCLLYTCTYRQVTFNSILAQCQCYEIIFRVMVLSRSSIHRTFMIVILCLSIYVLEPKTGLKSWEWTQGQPISQGHIRIMYAPMQALLNLSIVAKVTYALVVYNYVIVIICTFFNRTIVRLLGQSMLITAIQYGCLTSLLGFHTRDSSKGYTQSLVVILFCDDPEHEGRMVMVTQS